jgi:hypothetical protein
MGTEEEKKGANDAMESGLWLALRASRNNFDVGERIENGKNMEALLDKMAAPRNEDAETAVEAE